jgi:hypothetical protein
LVAVYNNTNGEGDEENNEGCRLVPAQPYRYRRTDAGLDVGIGD